MQRLEQAMTDAIEAQAYEYFAKIDELGGMVQAVKLNYPQREIANASYELQAEIDAVAIQALAIWRGR